jgi:hypothetical protein
MSLAVVGGSSLIKCSFGLVPTPLIVLPDRTVLASSMLMGNITDFKPMANIMTFGMCTSMANPQVMTATIMALGVLTPMPCVPIVVAPWITAAVNVMATAPVLDQTSISMCIWAGVITVLQPGNFTVMVP